eukprot:evm.model.NODE_26015_length_37756_cov_44.158253.7
MKELVIKQRPGFDSGCTAVAVIYEEGREGGAEGGRLYVANAGDSRCVLSRGRVAVELSRDHKPEDVEEKARIEAAGGSVGDDGRVEGNLNLSRAIGDLAYKHKEGLSAERQMISAYPDVRVEGVRAGEDEFLVVACDGIWNVLSSQEVVDMVREGLREGGEEGELRISKEYIARKLVQWGKVAEFKKDLADCRKKPNAYFGYAVSFNIPVSEEAIEQFVEDARISKVSF